ncbi:hypothetical protein [Moorella sulfitireducens (nom. illeg.)]|uniref:hypothetical protein n=1 Tax=Neomoorella sulfitireducens TaxID=2972948 RepID=UPI0021ABA72E|nr:hypothetical protein [Moorella sulfitireducens]
MSYKVKATLVAFLGEPDKYPCHFCYELGDEIIFDGEKCIGRVCPDLFPPLVQKAMAMHVAGPRYVDPGYWYPFWYAPPSVKDLSLKKYDGLGFRNVLKTIIEPPTHMRNLLPPDAFVWPPTKERVVAKDVTVLCPDLRTAGLFKLEVIDLSDKGFDVPYFRRQMCILDRVIKNPGINLDKIPSKFTEKQIMDIYPPLVPEMLRPLAEEIELVGYMEIKDGQCFATEKGIARLKDFIATLTDEEVELLGVGQ